MFQKIKREAFKYDIGHVTMVLSLFASANNMKGVVRGEYDPEKINNFLGLSNKEYVVVLAFSLGY